MDQMLVAAIAEVCHEANRAYCESIGDYSQSPWRAAEPWQQDSAIKGVRFAIENPDAPVSAQHDTWMKDKIADGWEYGPEKLPVSKKHPCIVPYEQLPIEQRRKDALFKGIVSALTSND